MAATINASTSAGVVTTADTSGNLNLQSNGTTIIGYTSAGAAVTGTLSASGAVTTAAITATGQIKSTVAGHQFNASPSVGTGYASFYASNTGGETAFAVDTSTGSAFSTAGNYGTVIYRAASTQLSISRGATIDVNIATTGEVGIGNTSAAVINSNNGWGDLVVGSGSGNAGYTIYTSGSDSAGIAMARATTGGGSYAGYIYYNHPTDALVFGTNATLHMTLSSGGNLNIIGALSKGSGSFRITHPLPALADTHQLVHSFIEGPQADLIYRGKVNLVAGKATINIDSAATMTEGTFVLLCRDVQCFTSNETDWNHVRGSVNGNILTVDCQDPTSTALISWMVIGERQDKHMMETEWTDENGKVIVEPEKKDPQPRVAALENK